jgi:hypothetical protein
MSVALTRYPVIELAPSEEGADHDTFATAFPAVA